MRRARGIDTGRLRNERRDGPGDVLCRCLKPTTAVRAGIAELDVALTVGPDRSDRVTVRMTDLEADGNIAGLMEIRCCLFCSI